MTELLDAVDALTLPSRTKVPQWVTRDGKEVQVVTVIDHHPLLVQLENAITGTMDGVAGTNATLASARGVLNSDALFRFLLIKNMIRDWCTIAGVGVRKDPVDGLRAWYVARLAMSDRDDAWYLTQLHGWARQITTVISPARTFPLTDPCPACGADEWVDADGSKLRHPVVIEYHDGDVDLLARAKGLCRACDRVWRGSHELRSLRWDLDQKETQVRTA